MRKTLVIKHIYTFSYFQNITNKKYVTKHDRFGKKEEEKHIPFVRGTQPLTLSPTQPFILIFIVHQSSTLYHLRGGQHASVLPSFNPTATLNITIESICHPFSSL